MPDKKLKGDKLYPRKSQYNKLLECVIKIILSVDLPSNWPRVYS